MRDTTRAGLAIAVLFATGALPGGAQSPQLSREYIYAGGRLVAVENAATLQIVANSVQHANVTATGVTIAWQTNMASDSTVSYRVAGSSTWATAANAVQVTSHSIALTGLAAGTVYEYKASSAASGQTTVESAVQQFQTLPAAANQFTLEGEAGILTGPMAQATDGGGVTYVSTATANQGQARFTVVTASAGDFVLWARVWAETSGSNSFTVSVDGAADTFDACLGKLNAAWQWCRVTGRAVTGVEGVLNPRLASLAAGTHTIDFAGAEAGTKLDKFVLTNDLNYDPAGTLVPEFMASEAEALALVSPMAQQADASALEGQAIGTATANSGTATYAVTVPRAGLYTVWLRALAPSAAQDSLYVKLDGIEDLWEAVGPVASYKWYRLNGRGGIAFNTVALRTAEWAAGTHTVEVRGAEAGVKLDRVVVTNDLMYAPGATVPVISNVSATAGASGATITWTTNELSAGEVEYGATTSYGATAVSAGYKTAHSVTLTGLVSAWTYNYRVKARDAEGNLAAGTNLTFTTGAPGCSLSETALTFRNPGEMKTTTLTCPAGVSWVSSTSEVAWITLNPVSGTSTGPGVTVQVTAANANGGAARSGTVTIAGLALAVSQSGPSTVTITNVPATPLAAGGTRTLGATLDGVTVGDNCTLEWSVVSGLGSITTAGLCGNYTAPALVPPDQTSVTVRAYDPSGGGAAQATFSLQAYYPPGGLQVTPWSGMAVTQNFSFAATNAGGASQVRSVTMLWHTTSANFVGACAIKVDPGGTAPFVNSVWVSTNGGTTWQGGVPMAVTPAQQLENSQCRFRTDQMSVTAVGTTVTVTATVTFKPGFTGTKNVYLAAENEMQTTPLTLVGSWDLTANAAARAPKLTVTSPASGATLTGTVTVAGWALDNEAQIENGMTAVNVYLDNTSTLLGYATRGKTSTACTTYPDRPDCPNVGWDFSWNTLLTSNGAHTLIVEAVDGDYPTQRTATVNVPVTINNPPAYPVTVQPTPVWVPISWNSTPAVWQTKQFTAYQSGSPSSNVDWSSFLIGGALQNPGTVSAAGLWTAPATTAYQPGDMVGVRATEKTNGQNYSHATVYIMGYFSYGPLVYMSSGGGSLCFWSYLGDVTYSVDVGGVLTQQANPACYAVAWGAQPGAQANITATQVSDQTKRQTTKVVVSSGS